MTSRVIRALDAISQFGNVVLFGGDPNYSISGEAYRRQRELLRKFIDMILSPFERDHCRRAYENDVAKARKLVEDDAEMQGAQNAKEYRNG